MFNYRLSIICIVLLWTTIGILAGFDVGNLMVRIVGPALILASALAVGFGLIRFHRLAQMAESFILVALIAIFGLAITMIAAAVSPFPMADSALLVWEKAIGYDWLAMQQTIAAHPTLLAFLFDLYFAFPFLTLLVAWSIDIGGHREWRQRYILALVIGLNLTAIIAFFIPSVSEIVHLGGDRSLLPDSYGYLFDTAGAVDTLRAGGMRDFRPLMGIVAMPSFHTAAAVIYAFGLWVYPTLRVPAVVFAGLVIATAITIGGHFLADIILGFVVGVVSILATEPVQARQGKPATRPVRFALGLNSSRDSILSSHPSRA